MFTFFNTLIGIGIIIIGLVTLSVWILAFLQETENRYYRFLKKYSLGIAWIIALGATLGSLAYEFIFALPPCTYCWWQRIFMYPQVVILGIGLYLKDLKVIYSSIILSIIGASFSVYHILLQAGIRSSGLPCELNGVSCTKIDILIFGWITIPIMCLIAFIGIITFAYLAHKKTA
jgi:disulfide bond formation protein DsbB